MALLPNPNAKPDIVGYHAYYSPYKDEDSNPYPAGSTQAAEWLAGYKRAATECAKPGIEEDEDEPGDDEDDEEESDDEG